MGESRAMRWACWKGRLQSEGFFVGQDLYGKKGGDLGEEEGEGVMFYQHGVWQVKLTASLIGITLRW